MSDKTSPSDETSLSDETSPSDETRPQEESAPPLVRADALSLNVKQTSVWSDLDFSFGAGLNAVCGPSGSGRSSLLLAVTGRMSGLTGSLTVAGEDAIVRPRRVRAISSVARLSTMIVLEPRLTVAESITERALIDGLPTDRSLTRMAELEDLVGRRFPKPSLVERLAAFDQTLLAACLACLRPARLMVLDDADLGLTADEQTDLFAALSTLSAPSLTEDGPAVVVSTRDLTTLPVGTPVLQLPNTRPESN